MSAKQPTQIKDSENPVYQSFRECTRHRSLATKRGYVAYLLSIADPTLKKVAPYPVGTPEADAYDFAYRLAFQLTLPYRDCQECFAFAHFETI